MFSTQLLCFFVSSHLSLLSLCQWISEAYQWGRGLEEILSWMKNSFPCNDKEAGDLGPLPTERRCISQIYHWFTFSEELHLIHNDVHVQKSNFDIRDWGFSCLKSTSKPTESDAKQIFFLPSQNITTSSIENPCSLPRPLSLSLVWMRFLAYPWWPPCRCSGVWIEMREKEEWERKTNQHTFAWTSHWVHLIQINIPLVMSHSQNNGQGG